MTYLAYATIQIQRLKLKRTFAKSCTKMVYFLQLKAMHLNIMGNRQWICVYNSEAAYVTLYTLSRT